MNLNWLKTFSVLMQTENFQLASKQLGCSQPTVSIQIGQLENYLRVQLFERVGRKSVPTKKAYELLPHVNNVLDGLRQLETFKHSNPELTGVVKVGICDGIVTYKLPGVFREFLTLAPNVSVITVCDTAAKLKDKVVQGELDLAVTFNTGDYPASASRYPLQSLKLSLITNSRSQIPSQAFMFPNQKIEAPLVTGNSRSGPSKFFNEFLKKFNIRLSGTIELSGIEMVKAFLLENIGFAYTLEQDFAKEIESGDLKTMKTALGEVTIGLILLKNTNKSESACVSVLSRKIIRSLGDVSATLDEDAFYKKNKLKNQML